MRHMAPHQLVPFELPPDWNRPENLAPLDGAPFNCVLFPEGAAPSIAAAASAKGWQAYPLKQAPVKIREGVWPGLRLNQSTSESAGPTGTPWLDANGWVAQLARAEKPADPCWIRTEIPENASQQPEDMFLFAALEPVPYGALRVVALPPSMARPLGAGDAAMRSRWQGFCDLYRWMLAQCAKTSDWAVVARLGILSNFAGANEFISGEVLNLAARRNLAYRVLFKDRVQAEALRGLKAVLYIDVEPPPPPLLKLLDAFVASGGLLLSPPATAAKFASARAASEVHPRFHLRTYGRGRIAASKEDWGDPYVVAQDTHLLMSRRHDSVRLFNAGSLQFHHVAAPQGGHETVHLLNYTLRPSANPVSLQSWRTLKSAKFLSAGGREPVPLEIHKQSGYSELHIPAFPMYAAIELEI